jgi:hypothetical protein
MTLLELQLHHRMMQKHRLMVWVPLNVLDETAGSFAAIVVKM